MTKQEADTLKAAQEVFEASIKSYEELWDDEYYIRSATAGDYSPGSPWNAPGMNIRDFI